MLSWIDICAGLAAKTVARGPVVTASVDTVHFLRPCHQGSVAIIAAMVNRVFQSSMEASTVMMHACSCGSVSGRQRFSLQGVVVVSLRIAYVEDR